jgi:carboxyl-terminal processing protease
MPVSRRVPIPILVLLVVLAPAAVRAAPAAPPPDTPVAVLDAVWTLLESDLYDAERARERLTPVARARLAQAARAAPDLHAFAPTLAAFLGDLGVSHTAFLTDREIDWYFFRSLFVTRDADRPRVHHMGAQFVRRGGGHVIRAVLDGGPAARAGLRRGDRVTTADGAPFDPHGAFAPDGAPARLSVRRGDAAFEVTVTPVLGNPHRAFVEATGASVRTIERDGRRFGVLRLWVGTHPETLATLERAVRETFADHDGLILDLRGGYGGAWHAHLDPFFADRADYFTTHVIDRDGAVETIAPESVEPHAWYEGPLVVLIDEGTRSGKEALAWQLKRRPATTVVGTTTAGAFTAGRGEFLAPGVPYFLYLAVAEFRPDGEAIEGIGVAPDVRVPYPLDDAPATDPQFARAILELARLVAGHGPGRVHRPQEER